MRDKFLSNGLKSSNQLVKDMFNRALYNKEGYIRDNETQCALPFTTLLAIELFQNLGSGCTLAATQECDMT